ncbi:uncharacterized protein LOC128555879 [Mercenaria mercenaria]|uniref:uncharacterized protein LOC128555879 n=1 Tax=Mercenaria mercenaria TaxID=6596 RepID=UPI00234F2C70|nr:uncharacterized protein LOC128555879 [Mercenaria mercenaria]
MSNKKSLKHLRSKDELFVTNVSEYFKKNPGPDKRSIIQRTIQATGVSRRTIYRLWKERSKRAPYKPVDGFDESVIRNKIHEFYTYSRQLPTLKNLLTVLKTEIGFPGSRWLLRKTLRKMGFVWKRTTDNRKVLIEKPSIVRQRLAFYAKKKELEDKGYCLVYMDETWIDTAFTAKRCWQRDDLPGVIPPCNRGQRLLVVHAESRNGFIKGAQLVYKASSSSGDYHHEMNGQNFTKWLKEKLLPNLHSPSAIVMENASYHSMQAEKFPTSSSRKQEIKEWLRKQNIAFDDGLLKPQLLDLCRLHKLEPSYSVDQIIRRHGHEVLRLPPYHPDFNAIELIWSQLKILVRHRNFTFSYVNQHNKSNETVAISEQEEMDTHCQALETCDDVTRFVDVNLESVKEFNTDEKKDTMRIVDGNKA